MKISPLVLATVVIPWSALAQQQADVRLYCNSLRFHSVVGSPGRPEALTLTSDSTGNEINGEVGQSFDPLVYFHLSGGIYPNGISGQISISMPDFVDTNDNGFDDFFEVRQEVPPTTTDGFLTLPDAGGNVTAVWRRPGGSATGVCHLTLAAASFGKPLEFDAEFDLIEYVGLLKYTPQTNAVMATVALSQTVSNTQAGTNTLSGTMIFTRVSSNRFDQLNLSAGSLTNASGQVLSFAAAAIERDQTTRTNYYGDILFTDGAPTTRFADFRLWTLSIDDAHDRNGNGVPDLSDDPPTAVSAPLLSLRREEGHLLLSIQAAAPGSYDLQQSLLLPTPSWEKASSITVTSDPQSLVLPLPTTPSHYWRLSIP